MLKRISFRGGYRFNNFQGQPEKIIDETFVPAIAKIPLMQGFGSETDCLVKIGDRVSAGQVIARNDQNISSPILATINGIISDIEKTNYFGQNCAIVTIKGNGSSEYEKLSSEDIEEKLYLSGVTALGYSGIPSRFNSSVIKPDEVENIIIYSSDSDPFNISPKLLFSDKSIQNLYSGIDVLHKIMPNAIIYIATSPKYKSVLYGLDDQLNKHDWLKYRYLRSKYPQNHQAMLVQTVLGQKFPYGYSSANIGTIILDFQSVLYIYEAIAEDKPLVEITIALCGSVWKEPSIIKVRIGTMLGDLVQSRIKEGIKPRFILNNLLMGTELTDLSIPIDRSYSQIIAIPENNEREFLKFVRLGFKRDSYSRTFASNFLPLFQKEFETNKHGEERPCVSCNYCEEVCPVGIIPHIISKYVKRSMIDETLANLHIYDCIQCGLCSYVCPSKIPLVQHIKEGMNILTEQGCTRDQCILPHFDNILGIVDSYRGAKEI
ncbi:MAG: 4Fe-4S dicluster domain-containing protein [Candidatus Poribacteria bacterium]